MVTLVAREAVPVPSAGALTLRFEIRGADTRVLAALCRVRREMLWDEQSRVLAPEEPPLADAVFSPREIVWTVKAQQRERCLQKLAALVSSATAPPLGSAAPA